MELGAFKPLLTSLLMPPLAPLLLALLGVLLAWRKKRGGLALTTLSLLALWLLSCHGTAVWLARHALPQFAPVSAAQLKAGGIQAIVILGGGLLPEAPEYGEPQPDSHTDPAALRRLAGAPIGLACGLYRWSGLGGQWRAAGIRGGSGRARGAARLWRHAALD